MLAFCVSFADAALARHAAFVSNAQDLGYFDQTIWGSARGRPLHFTVYDLNLTIPEHQTFLAYHVEPLLILIAPIYWLWDDVRAILIPPAGRAGAGGDPGLPARSAQARQSVGRAGDRPAAAAEPDRPGRASE